jgi:hypothetical protein
MKTGKLLLYLLFILLIYSDGPVEDIFIVQGFKQ